MATPLLRAYRYCRGDGSLTIAVGVLILFVLVLYPMVEVGATTRLWLDPAFALGLAFGAYFVFEPRPLIRVSIVFLLATFVLRGSEPFVDHPWLTILGIICALCACFVFALLLLVRAMRDGRIFGGLFLTVLVARLVGLAMEWREEQRAWRMQRQQDAERRPPETST